MTAYRWTQITGNAAFAPRDGAGALVYKNRMWLLGGWNPHDKVNFPRICNNEVWSSIDGKNWDLVKPNTFTEGLFDRQKDWEGRHTAGYAVFEDRMWIIGGDINQGHHQNDVWSSTNGRNWECFTDQVPWAPRILHYTLAFKDRLWVMGGQSTAGNFADHPVATCFYDDVWSSTDGRNWEQMEVRRPSWPARGMIGGSTVFKDRMWIIGGGTYDTPDVPLRRFFNDVWSSSDGVHWERHAEYAPWNPRQYHDVAVFDDRLWVMEGCFWDVNQPLRESPNRKDVWLSEDGVHWHEVPDTPWKPRHAASVFVFKRGLWMVAGNNMESDVWKLERTT